MKKLLLLIFISLSAGVFAQDKPLKGFWKRANTERTGQFYFYWGYNRAAYTRSDISIHGPEYDFTVFNVKAHDRPTPVSNEAYYNPALITIPQFDFRIGYCVNEKWSVSFGWDHMKYVMDANQVAEVSGYINHPVNKTYNGSYLRQKMVIAPDLLKFEHTDGLNVVSFDAERKFRLVSNARKSLQLYALTGAGTGVMYPRTDVKVTGVGLNNDWHISGYHLNAKTGLRLEFLKYGFVTLESRAGYINMPDILVQNDQAHRINQHFFFLQGYFAFGMYVPILKKN